jgi:glucose-6-phosphate isomerase
MHYTQDLENCFADNIGGSAIWRENFDTACKLAISAKKMLDSYQHGKLLPILKRVVENDDIAILQEVAEKIRRDFECLIVLGTGGSTLNPQSIVALKQKLNHDFKIYFADNLDPIFTEILLAGIDIHKTAFLATSKSGGTIEVLAHTLIFITKLEEAGIKDLGRRFFIISDSNQSVLRKIGQEIGATILEHEADIGGRFSTFTKVSLLPALVAKLDVNAFRQGAAGVVNNFLQNDLSYPLEGAALAITAMNANLPINVFMPYIEALKPFTTWVCQIWAESLGKDGKGSTPVRASGTLDQHSQLQLYIAGPADKLFNIIGMENAKIGPIINSRFAKIPEIAYLQDKYFGDVNMAAQQGTAASISKNGRPVRLISLKKLDEESLGALMMHFTLETILAAQMLQINAFDQPAVEEGKILARKILGHI